MKMRCLSPEAARRAIELARGSYRPKPILDQQRMIESAKRSMQLQKSFSGEIDEDRLQSIVGLMLDLDALYGEWAEGRIS